MNCFESKEYVLQKEVELIIAKLYFGLSLRGIIAQNSFAFTQSRFDKNKIVIWSFDRFGFKQEYGEIYVRDIDGKLDGLVIWNNDENEETKGHPFDFIRSLLSFDEGWFTKCNPPKQEQSIIWKTVSWMW